MKEWNAPTHLLLPLVEARGLALFGFPSDLSFVAAPGTWPFVDEDEMTLADEKAMAEVDEKIGKTAVTSLSPVSDAPIVIDSPEERRLVRKLDGRIMPIVCILYLFACECIDQCSSYCVVWTELCT